MLDPRIWATRPAHQNGQWHESMAELGFPVVDLPLMMIEPVHEPAEIQAVKNLILDFDMIENGAKMGAPKYMEWFAAFGLLVTIVWLYLEILRLLSKLQRD